MNGGQSLSMNGGLINGGDAEAILIKSSRLAAAEMLVRDLGNPDRRENAFAELSKNKDLFQDMALTIWNAFGVIAALLQEIVSIYPGLSPPSLTPQQVNRVCNALALLQSVASHQDTRMQFLNANISLYLHPFITNPSKSKHIEYLRLTSLGVIGALVKADDKDAVQYLLETEIIPLCLKAMDIGTELTMTVATYIVQKIVLDDGGLEYICTAADRFFAVTNALNNMVLRHVGLPAARLLKHIIRCYLCLSEHPRGCDALRNHLPDILKHPRYTRCLVNDDIAARWIQLLAHNITRGNRFESNQAPGVEYEHLRLN